MALHKQITSRSIYIFVTPTKKIEFSKILHQQCIIHWQSKCEISVESAKANNGYSDFSEVTPQQSVSGRLCV